MRRLLLCLAAIAAASAYNLVIQELTLTGGRINSDEINCKNINGLQVGGDPHNIDCHDVFSPTDPKTIESRKIAFMDTAITTKASTLNCVLSLSDGSTLEFPLKPNMQPGKLQTPTIGVTYKPVGKSLAPTTTTVAPTTTADYCAVPDNTNKLYCFCQIDANKNSAPCTKCKDVASQSDPDCQAPAPGTQQSAKLPAKATKVELPLPLKPEVAVDSVLPPAVRLRGPGPARPPARRFPHPVEDSVVEEEDEVRRVKRDDNDPPKVDDTTISLEVAFYVLDEPGNPAAVWAAVIEGIVLLVLVGACLYFFCWAPRTRAAASASADPYKPEGNYSVSYANSSYNNQRIDAFQNPPPAAPPRPANSAYMDDYITDNIGAMGRPAATTTQPAAPAASAANSATSTFQPGHQRFDSSGLVTVNLS